MAAHQASRSSPDDPWRQQEEEKFVQHQEFFSKENVGATARGGRASGKQHEVKQEEEFNDDGFVVGLSFIDHEGARHCAISGTFCRSCLVDMLWNERTWLCKIAKR